MLLRVKNVSMIRLYDEKSSKGSEINTRDLTKAEIALIKISNHFNLLISIYLSIT